MLTIKLNGSDAYSYCGIGVWSDFTPPVGDDEGIAVM